MQTGTVARLWEVDATSLFNLFRSFCKLSPSYHAGVSRLVSLLGPLPNFGDVALAPIGPTASELMQTLEVAVTICKLPGLSYRGAPFNLDTWLADVLSKAGSPFAVVRAVAVCIPPPPLPASNALPCQPPQVLPCGGTEGQMPPAPSPPPPPPPVHTCARSPSPASWHPAPQR
jgi:hypothetical protein